MLSNVLFFTMCLSVSITNYVQSMTFIIKVVEPVTQLVIEKSDIIAKSLNFNDTSSLCKSSFKFGGLLFILIPMYRYLTSGKNFNNASSDEELTEAINAVRRKISVKSMSSLSRELLFKIVRMIRSKLGYHSYLLAIKEEKTDNSDGSINSLKELKTVGATGWCRSIEELVENVVFLANIGIGIAAIQGINNGLDQGNLLLVLTNLKLSWNKYYS